MGPLGSLHPKQGAALAWLAHLDLVKYFIMSDYDTALILEDDVDWDVNIKEQTVRIAEAVRAYTNVTRDGGGTVRSLVGSIMDGSLC